MRFTAEQKQREAEREVVMRRDVYRRRVEQRLMSPHEADHKIKIMQEIAADYAVQAEKERLL